MTVLPLDRIYHWESATPDDIFLTQPLGGVARHWTWKQTLDEARRVANYLISNNWPPGSHVVIFSKNSAWWIMAEFAIWMAGHVTVPIYPSLTPQSARQLFQHCDPVACFVGVLEKPELGSEAIPANCLVIGLPDSSGMYGVSWDEVVKGTEPLSTHPLRSPEEIATIIYTSGTTGLPKGAMHRFSAFPFLAKAVAQVVGEVRHRAMSYLPLAHIAERSLTETTAVYYGWHLFFGESVATFITDLKRARPTVFFSVPRLYTKFQQKVLEKISREALNRLLTFPGVKMIVGKYVIHNLGLGSVKFAASGSAPLPLDLLAWYRSLGFPLTEGYGTTETGITYTAPNGESRPGWVGKNAPGVETRISDAGEVLLRSPMNMVGYYKNSEDTQRVFTEDGFIHTGDLGEVSNDGWLKITGRLSEQFKTSKGKFVSPAKIEALLSENAAVDHCLVLRTATALPCAIAVLTPEALQRAATETGRKDLEKSFEDLLNSVNERIEHHEKLAFVALVNTRWTIDSGFVTPTLKLKRAAIEAYYRELMPVWTEQGTRVVWQITA
jgi:long-chain acyl-CoA synthetase